MQAARPPASERCSRPGERRPRTWPERPKEGTVGPRPTYPPSISASSLWRWVGRQGQAGSFKPTAANAALACYHPARPCPAHSTSRESDRLLKSSRSAGPPAPDRSWKPEGGEAKQARLRSQPPLAASDPFGLLWELAYARELSDRLPNSY